MRLLVLGGDPKIFDKNSEGFSRIKDYAGLFDELHIVSSARRGTKAVNFGDKLFLYPASGIFRFFKMLILGKRIIKKAGIDALDAQDPSEFGLAALFLAKMSRLPFRTQIHTDIFSPWFRRASLKEYLRYILAKFVIPRADCLRVVSQRIKKSILEKYPRLEKRVFVLPIFVDINKFVPAPKKLEMSDSSKGHRFKMIAMGRFVDKEKNFGMLIEIMRDFVKKAPNSLLVLVGDGPDKENYKLQITNYKLNGNIIIKPWRDDFSSFLGQFDLFLLPSNYEGWGRAAIEAMASGVAVVMTEVGLAEEVVRNGENGLVTAVKDKEAFLKEIEKIYFNPQLRLKLARAGRETVKNLKPNSKKEYLRLYRESFSACLKSTLMTISF